MRWLRRRRARSRDVDATAASPLRRALHHVLAGELPAAELEQEVHGLRTLPLGDEMETAEAARER